MTLDAVPYARALALRSGTVVRLAVVRSPSGGVSPVALGAHSDLAVSDGHCEMHRERGEQGHSIMAAEADERFRIPGDYRMDAAR